MVGTGVCLRHEKAARMPQARVSAVSARPPLGRSQDETPPLTMREAASAPVLALRPFACMCVYVPTHLALQALMPR